MTGTAGVTRVEAMTQRQSRADDAATTSPGWRAERPRLRLRGLLLAVALNALIVWIAVEATSRSLRERPREPAILMLTLPPLARAAAQDKRAGAPPVTAPRSVRDRPTDTTAPPSTRGHLPAMPNASMVDVPSMHWAPAAPAGMSGAGAAGPAPAGVSMGEAEVARLADLRVRGLDVMFVIDATGSMDWVLADITDRIREMVDTLHSLVPLTRLGIAAYRDPDDPEFLVRVQPLTYSSDKLKAYLSNLKASGGGGLQEAVDAGIEAAVRQAGWRKGAQAVIVLIGDAPPYESALGHTRRMVKAFAAAGGQIFVVDVSDQANPELVERQTGRKVDHALYRRTPMYQFSLIAEAGGAAATTLQGDLELSRRLISLVIGARSEALLAAAAAAGGQ